MSDSLQPHESQHARPPCPSPTPGVHSDSRSSSQWSHPAISSSVIPFSPCPQSLPASESFPMSQLFTWGGQSTGVSALDESKLLCRRCWLKILYTNFELKSRISHFGMFFLLFIYLCGLVSFYHKCWLLGWPKSSFKFSHKIITEKPKQTFGLT